MNPDTIDWNLAWSIVAPAVQDADMNAVLSLACFGGFSVLCLLGTLFNLRSLRKRGERSTGTILGGLGAMVASGAVALGGALSMNAEAHAIHARVGTCRETGHGHRYMDLTVLDAVGFDAAGSWPIEEDATGWDVNPDLCDTLSPGTEHILLCATGGTCPGTL